MHKTFFSGYVIREVVVAWKSSPPNQVFIYILQTFWMARRWDAMECAILYTVVCV